MIYMYIYDDIYRSWFMIRYISLPGGFPAQAFLDPSAHHNTGMQAHRYLGTQEHYSKSGMNVVHGPCKQQSKLFIDLWSFFSGRNAWPSLSILGYSMFSFQKRAFGDAGSCPTQNRFYVLDLSSLKTDMMRQSWGWKLLYLMWCLLFLLRPRRRSSFSWTSAKHSMIK